MAKKPAIEKGMWVWELTRISRVELDDKGEISRVTTARSLPDSQKVDGLIQNDRLIYMRGQWRNQPLSRPPGG